MRRRGVDRVLEGRLEALAEVEDEVGIRDRAHVAAGELEVVRLDAGRSQVAHVDSRAADLLSGESQRIEGRDHGAAALRARVPPQPASAATRVRVRTILVFTGATVARDENRYHLLHGCGLELA